MVINVIFVYEDAVGVRLAAKSKVLHALFCNTYSNFQILLQSAVSQ